MEKIIHKLINEFTEGVDTYTHNNSTWLIFTETKQWVIELTDNKTLWYNYNFFKSVFAYASLDCVQNQHLITKWVEDNVMNKVNYTFSFEKVADYRIEDTLENGVKETKISPTHTEYGDWLDGDERLGEIIKNGVKETKQKDRARLILDIDGRGLILETNLVIRDGVKETNHVDVMKFFDNKMEDTLENGVKSSRPRQYVGENIIDKIIDKGVIETHREICEYKHTVEHIIQTGVKETIECDWNIPKYVINEVIIEGVKETNHVDVMKFFDNKMEDTLKNGVRHTLNTEYMPTSMVEDIIQNGVKETKTPGKDGDIMSTIEWMEENKSTSYTKMIDDVIDNGEKINGTYVGGKRQKENIESVIGYGTKNPSV